MAYNLVKHTRIFLYAIGALLLFLGSVAGMSSIRDRLILKNHDGYSKETFVVSGTRLESKSPDSDSNHYVIGKGPSGDYEIAIGVSRYESLSKPDLVGTRIEVYRNPSMHNIVFQKESVNVLFADQWRELDELRISAKSTMWIAAFCLLGGLVLLGAAKVVSK